MSGYIKESMILAVDANRFRATMVFITKKDIHFGLIVRREIVSDKYTWCFYLSLDESQYRKLRNVDDDDRFWTFLNIAGDQVNVSKASADAWQTNVPQFFVGIDYSAKDMKETTGSYLESIMKAFAEAILMVLNHES